MHCQQCLTNHATAILAAPPVEIGTWQTHEIRRLTIEKAPASLRLRPVQVNKVNIQDKLRHLNPTCQAQRGWTWLTDASVTGNQIPSPNGSLNSAGNRSNSAGIFGILPRRLGVRDFSSRIQPARTVLNKCRDGCCCQNLCDGFPGSSLWTWRCDGRLNARRRFPGNGPFVVTQSICANVQVRQRNRHPNQCSLTDTDTPLIARDWQRSRHPKLLQLHVRKLSNLPRLRITHSV